MSWVSQPEALSGSGQHHQLTNGLALGAEPSSKHTQAVAPASPAQVTANCHLYMQVKPEPLGVTGPHRKC